MDMRYQEKIEEITAKIGAKFIDYRPETGSWVFEVFAKFILWESIDNNFISNECIYVYIVLVYGKLWGKKSGFNKFHILYVMPELQNLYKRIIVLFFIFFKYLCLLFKIIFRKLQKTQNQTQGAVLIQMTVIITGNC